MSFEAHLREISEMIEIKVANAKDDNIHSQFYIKTDIRCLDLK
jgi:hypothetical protein